MRISLDKRRDAISLRTTQSQIVQQHVLRDLLDFTYFSQNCLEDTNSQRLVAWHRDTMVGRGFSYKDHVAADLTHLFVIPIAAQKADDVIAADIARQPHAKTSSRTIWRRIVCGFGLSK